jgi:hypothetical protein
MSLRVGKEDVYFILPESRYSVSTRIDRYMEEDFTLYVKARCIKESLEIEKEAFLFARNGMHTGISFYKDKFGEVFISFTYWFKDKDGRGHIEQIYYPLTHEQADASNEFTMICDNFVDRKIDCYVNKELVGTIDFKGMDKQSYEGGFYWLGCGTMIGPEQHKCIGDFEIDTLFLLNKNIEIAEIDDILDNYKDKYTTTVHNNLKKLNKDYPLKKHFAFFCDFNERNRYKVWDISFNGNNPQVYIENNIYF